MLEEPLTRPFLVIAHGTLCVLFTFWSRVILDLTYVKSFLLCVCHVRILLLVL